MCQIQTVDVMKILYAVVNTTVLFCNIPFYVFLQELQAAQMWLSWHVITASEHFCFMILNP
jgi:hypothetical protein